MINQNQPSTPTWDKSHGSIFENFALNLSGFTRTGVYPSESGQDVKHGLELQFERLKNFYILSVYHGCKEFKCCCG